MSPTAATACRAASPSASSAGTCPTPRPDRSRSAPVGPAALAAVAPEEVVRAEEDVGDLAAVDRLVLARRARQVQLVAGGAGLDPGEPAAGADRGRGGGRLDRT